ncbi:DNA polymerase eta subunit [Paragonimus heterotremus]|uniref:DNA polymerase eta n=1 Tax=Paragonimus heterotremus TaxID=100268 RepID=A0A8J4WNV4_9TREM|nr:DNA polymerase eta subunit [Paragonimus heterotremus]
MDRIVMLIDMDCFYVQVEQRSRPETLGKPCAVAQYNGTTGGGIIAVSYEARERGVKRGMWGKTALSKCSDLILFEVPEKRGKADLSKYRAAGAEVLHCVSEFFPEVERASIDEAFADLTEVVRSMCNQKNWGEDNTNIPNAESYVVMNSVSVENDHANRMSVSLNRSDWVGFLRESFSDGEQYAIASALTYKVRQAILARTGFRCSAGIAPNKTLAKLACSLNKPNKQTIVPPESATFLLNVTPVSKIRNLGGKLGTVVIERFHVNTLGELAQISLSELSEAFGEKTAQWLHDLCRGYDSEAVTPRSLPQSVGCSKNFVGRSVLTTTSQIEHWLRCLADELVERLLEDRQLHSRQATRLTLYVRTNEPVPPAGPSPLNGNGFSRVLPPNLLSTIYATVANQESVDAVCTTGSLKTNNNTAPSIDCEGLLAQKIARCALNVTDEVMGHGRQADVWNPGITCLGLSAGKFCSDTCALSTDIRALLQKQSVVKRDITPSVTATLTHISPNTTSVSDSKCFAPTDSTTGPPTSFFKRLCTAEISEPSLLTAVAPDSPECAVNNTELNEPVEEHDPSLTNFLTEHDTDSRSSTKSDSGVFFTSYIAGDWTVCEECGRRVAVWQVPEHTDFHLAQRLQHEWTQPQPTTIATTSTCAQNNSHTPALRSAARGHNRSRGRSSLKRKETITLDKFLIKRAS